MQNLIKTTPWLAVALLLAVPTAAAGNYAGGTIVAKYDFDYFPKPGSVTNSLCFYDVDNDGTYDAFETIVVDIDTATCATNVETDDIRLTPYAAYKAFSAVKTEEDDFDRTVVLLSGTTLIFYDENTNGKFDSKDAMYLDLFSVGSAQINQGDLRLTAGGGQAGGTFVKAGETDNTWMVSAFGAAFTDANILYKAGSAYYINADKGALNTADVGVEDGDVRILNKAPDPFAWNSSDITVTSLATSPANPTTGLPFQVVVALKNAGKEPAARFLETKWAGTLVDARSSPTLPPGAAATIVISLPAPTSTGTKVLTVAGNAANVTVDPGADVDGLKVAALEHELETLKAQLLAHGIDLEAEPQPPAGALEVQENSVEKAPGVDVALVVGALGLVVVMARRRKA